MPNWCDCDMYVSGPKADLEAFRVAALENVPESDEKRDPEVLDVNNFIPYPEKYREMDRAVERWYKENSVSGKKYGQLKPGVKFTDAPKDGFNSGGYEWCIQHWGTKWGICRSKVRNVTQSSLVYRFECAWSPCLPVIVAMSEAFKTLKFMLKYFERGAAYKGVFVVKGGTIIRHKESEYSGNRGG